MVRLVVETDDEVDAHIHGFNSSMVRLVEQKQYQWPLHHKFQFQYGAIGSDSWKSKIVIDY